MPETTDEEMQGFNIEHYFLEYVLSFRFPSKKMEILLCAIYCNDIIANLPHNAIAIF